MYKTLKNEFEYNWASLLTASLLAVISIFAAYIFSINQRIIPLSHSAIGFFCLLFFPFT